MPESLLAISVIQPWAGLITDALDWLQRQRREARADAAKEAAKLVRRGLKAIARKEWEEGQTLEAWTHEAEEWLATMRLAERIDRAAELEGENRG